MKWILFTGTFRLTDKRVEADVRQAVRDVIANGNGVLTGGATGVDYFAMDEAFKIDPTCAHLKVIIPADLESYIEDNRANGVLAPLTMRDIDELARVLRAIKRVNPRNLVEMPYTSISQEHYDLRDREEVRAAQEVYAFQVNESTGTQDTIAKAVANGIKLTMHKQYRI